MTSFRGIEGAERLKRREFPDMDQFIVQNSNARNSFDSRERALKSSIIGISRSPLHGSLEMTVISEGPSLACHCEEPDWATPVLSEIPYFVGGEVEVSQSPPTKLESASWECLGSAVSFNALQFELGVDVDWPEIITARGYPRGRCSRVSPPQIKIRTSHHRTSARR